MGALCAFLLAARGSHNKRSKEANECITMPWHIKLLGTDTEAILPFRHSRQCYEVLERLLTSATGKIAPHISKKDAGMYFAVKLSRVIFT